MVDEYQDTNKLQAQIVRLMTATHDNVAVVGDEFQSIYSFRGASHRNMLEFPETLSRRADHQAGRELPQHATHSRRCQRDYCRRQRRLYRSACSRVSREVNLRSLSARSDENEQSRFVAQRIEELREEGVPL